MFRYAVTTVLLCFSLRALTAPLSTTQLETRADTEDVGWGLAYLSESAKDSDKSTYHYLENSGKGVDIYVLDSGINPFPGSEGIVENFLDLTGTGYDDTYDHGTSVASLIGSDKYGSAKKPTIRNCKVMRDGKPDIKVVESTLDQIIKENDIRKQKPSYKGAIINMSFLAERTDALAGFIEKAVDNGITIIASAGNDNMDAKSNREYPCMDDHVICVGAMTQRYDRADSSNFGEALTLFAPGYELSGYDKTGAVRHDLEGTSFAAPYVTGIAAIYYGYEGRSMTPERVKSLLKQNGEIALISGKGKNSPNLLANSGFSKASKPSPYIGAKAPATVDEAPTQSCHTQYKVVLDSFDIWGADWDAAKLGDNGTGLHDQISGCATVSNWKFEPQTPSADSPWDFHASGQITIWQKTCIEHAMVSAGAPEGSTCSGSG